ncbi:DUF4393 domain-containing protein [Methylobacterium sp. NEAU 140]|uniref:DUF4393 domain-containing protein n=1 Tax=Methylobacterium sp. NEAU 140 TaxID=3064945 RepID=UPI0027369E24|nr:DUF4393 domain-containing protein [Methylobacterium sp. NEAU 140]MDP4027073.1 DUF4393 domain-containing protein [Methylobacterium sp. NEAU 140]
MTTEHDMAVAMATEIGKQVPVKQVYEDAGSPAVRQLGATLEDIVKCVRLVGFPVQWLAVQQDKFRARIERAKSQVPPENLMLPAPEILGPILEGIRYHIDDTPITEMFEALLARSMDKDRADEAHPAFIQIIKSLSPGEALILNRVHGSDLVIEWYEIPSTDGKPNEMIAKDLGGIDDFIENVPKYALYLNHLHSLNLCTSHSHSDQTNPERFVCTMTISLQTVGAHLMKACSRPEMSA